MLTMQNRNSISAGGSVTGTIQFLEQVEIFSEVQYMQELLPNNSTSRKMVI